MLTYEECTPEYVYLGTLGPRMGSPRETNPKDVYLGDGIPKDAFLGRLDHKKCLPRKTGPQKMLT
jgi:hypothetical protein